jgi:hypothetical protein
VNPGGTLPVDNVFIHDRRFQVLGIETSFVPSPLGQAMGAILKYPLAGPLHMSLQFRVVVFAR